MKTTYFALVGLLLSSGVWYESASADVAARRTAVVARGPAGGTVVAGSRTAVVRPGYRSLAQEAAVDAQQSKNSGKLDAAHVKPKE
jgi:hypothetical protein